MDGKITGHLEHAVEKSNAKDYLTECMPNVGISCLICNDKYKKVKERKRLLKKDVVDKFIESAKCKSCSMIPCDSYLELKREYLKNDNAHIILQPAGVTGEESGNPLMLQYDVLETDFIPSEKYDYTEEEKKFIQDHIEYFHLNDKEVKTKQLIRFLEDTVSMEGRYSKIEYNNMIVELFVKQILDGMTQEEVMKICQIIYGYSSLKFST